MSNIAIGRNPVIEALKHKDRVEKLLVQDGSQGSIKKIIALAKENKIKIDFVNKGKLDKIAEGKNHQGVIGFISSYEYVSLEEILGKQEDNKNSFVLILDGIEDPHNLGSIMRTAECAGVNGIIIPKRNSCGLTETVAKTSAGAIEYMPVARVTNIGRTIDELKEKGYWIYACNMGGEPFYDVNYEGKIAIVIGNEGKGISRLVMEKCDFTVSIPMFGEISSLNASNAASILMYEVVKQRNSKK